MITTHTQAIVLAGGKSSRFVSGSKLLADLCGKPMILYPLHMLATLGIKTTVVIGAHGEQVRKVVEEAGLDVDFVLQPEQKGTGHALGCTKDSWRADQLLVIGGDAPLLEGHLIESLYQKHSLAKAAFSFLTSNVMDPTGYGRVITSGEKTTIVEERDCTPEQREVSTINAGVYLISRAFATQAFEKLAASSVSGEVYLTEFARLASEQELPVVTECVSYDYVRGVDTLENLWAAEQIMRSDIISKHMQHGVRFDLAQMVHVDGDVTIGAGTRIGAGVYLHNGTRIGKDVTIEPYSVLKKVTVGDGAIVRSHTVLDNCTLGPQVHVGPFAHLHDNVAIDAHGSVGNFVEVKNSHIGERSKLKHLAYVGDATIGRQVNVGAGTITCNYDGVNKHPTTIEDNAFVGSNNTLVAPVTVGKGAYTAAGSTITEDVPAGDLAIGRSRQSNKPGYGEKLRKRVKKLKAQAEAVTYKTKQMLENQA